MGQEVVGTSLERNSVKPEWGEWPVVGTQGQS